MSVIDRSKSVIRIEPSAVYRLHKGSHLIRVIDGAAWITAEGDDIVAVSDGEVTVDGVEAPILISGLQGRGVALEVLHLPALAA